MADGWMDVTLAPIESGGLAGSAGIRLAGEKKAEGRARPWFHSVPRLADAWKDLMHMQFIKSKNYRPKSGALGRSLLWRPSLRVLANWADIRSQIAKILKFCGTKPPLKSRFARNLQRRDESVRHSHSSGFVQKTEVSQPDTEILETPSDYDILNELLLRELALLTPEDAAAVAKLTCPACGHPRIHQNPKCGHNYRSMSFINSIRLLRIYSAVQAEPRGPR